MAGQQVKKKKETLSESSQGPHSAREGISVLPTDKNSTLLPTVGLNSEMHVVSTDQPILRVSRA